MEAMRYFCMLFFVFLLILTEGGRITERKTDTGILHYAGCTRASVQVELSHPGCKNETFVTFGCAGFCKSEASLQKNVLVPKCTCCKPKEYLKFVVFLKCPGKDAYPQELLAARSCQCQVCSSPHFKRLQRKNHLAKLFRKG